MESRQDFYEKITQQISGVGSDVKGLRITVEQHILKDEEWKKSAMPAIEAWSNLKGFGKVGAILAGGIIGFASVLGAVYAMLNWIKER